MRIFQSALLAVLSTGFAAAADPALLHPEHWRRQAIEELAPLWLQHAPDLRRGGFHTSLSRRWEPVDPREKMPAMISRQVFGFCAAYLLSGDERYLEAARPAVRYLLERGWDHEFGGWFDRLTITGAPLAETKSAPLQLYTNVGLTMWAFVTGDREALERVHTSVEIRRRKGWDPIHGGYVQQLTRELAVADWGKNKHAHYGYVGSLLLNLYLTDGSAGTLAFSRELTDLSLERMRGPGGWLYGFHGKLGRDWTLAPKVAAGGPVTAVGAQLTAALSFFRLYQQTQEEKYLRAALELGKSVTQFGFDSQRGAWLDEIAAEPPHAPPGAPRIHWWNQIYGAFLQLHLYAHTRETSYLDNFEKTESFFEKHMLDREHGGVIKAVGPDGRPEGSMRKAGPWVTSYHELEHALLNYLYLSLYVKRQPAQLHFLLDGPGEFFVSPVDAPGVRVSSVVVDGRPWKDFDGQRRSVRLPPGGRQEVVVTLEP